MQNSFQLFKILLDEKQSSGKINFSIDEINLLIEHSEFKLKSEQRELFNNFLNKINENKIHTNYNHSYFYMNDNVVLLEYDFKNNDFYVNKYEIWSEFENRFDLTYDEISVLFKIFLTEFTGLKINNVNKRFSCYFY